MIICIEGAPHPAVDKTHHNMFVETPRRVASQVKKMVELLGTAVSGKCTLRVTAS
jgi:hypothetical protein